MRKDEAFNRPLLQNGRDRTPNPEPRNSRRRRSTAALTPGSRHFRRADRKPLLTPAPTSTPTSARFPRSLDGPIPALIGRPDSRAHWTARFPRSLDGPP